VCFKYSNLQNCQKRPCPKTARITNKAAAMESTQLKVLQASLDQLQRQLNAIYGETAFGEIDDPEVRKRLKAEASAGWTETYNEAKAKAAQG
jgi:hypothetical protein